MVYLPGGGHQTVMDIHRRGIQNPDNKPALFVETEQFQSLTLLSNQQIEEYYSKVIEKGWKISKNLQEVLLKFIQGLPYQMVFFVRASNLEDIHAV